MPVTASGPQSVQHTQIGLESKPHGQQSGGLLRRSTVRGPALCQSRQAGRRGPMAPGGLAVSSTAEAVLSQEPAPGHRARLTVGWTAAHHGAVGLSHSYLGARPTAPPGPAPAGFCFSRPMPPTMSAAPTPQPSPGLCRRVSESESAAHTSAGSLHPVPSSQDAGAPDRAGLPLTHRPGRLVTAMQTSANCKIPLRSHTGTAPTMYCLAAGMAQPRRCAATLLCSFWAQKASPQSC